MDIHKNGGVKLPSSSAKTNGKPTAMMGLRSSWLIEGSSDWTAVTHANGGQLKAAEDQKRSALEDGLKRRTTAAGKGDNVNDNSSADNVSDGDHCQTTKKNWSADDDKHDAKSDTCLPTTTSTTTRSHLGQIVLLLATMARPLLVGAFMAFFISVVQLYTWVTLPVYFLSQKPWQRRARNRRCRVKVTSTPAKSPFNSSSTDKAHSQLTEEEEEERMMSPVYERDYVVQQKHPVIHLDTVTEMLDRVVEAHGANNKALGYRQVLSEEISLDEQGNSRRIDGRQLKRYRLSEYQWLTYGQVDTFSRSIAQALFSKGIASTDKVLIISETRIEWMICAQAIIRTGATLVTLFSNLGVDGVAHGILETQVSTVIASIDCLPLLEKVLRAHAGRHSVRRLIYIDGHQTPDLAGFDLNSSSAAEDEAAATTAANESSVETMALSELEALGKKAIAAGTVRPLFRATPQHLMMIMYTSGTTGTPKAALMTHEQFTTSIKSLYPLVEEAISTAPTHTYISYLPMAHVLELTVESFFYFGGVKIGYASPFTLTDSAPGLVPGQKCDIKLLKPTVITAVPLVLDRILKEISDKLRARTPVSEPVFNFLMSYKSAWTRRGYLCNIVKNLLCKKVQEQLGGELQYMIVGGAPLAARTQATIKSALDLILIQGYGATETAGACLAMDFHDLEYGCVGAPLDGVKMRLKDWPEGGYSVRDKPYPRGEVVIGGGGVARGYFKLPRQTEEAFFTDRAGVRWFRTGDIGQIYPNGTLKVIDRLKDLVKLQNGEYISLGKVESALKGCQYVDNICVYGGHFSADLVAIISPNRKALDELVQRLDRRSLSASPLSAQVEDEQVEAEVYEEIVSTAKAAGLVKKEIPVRIKVVAETWSPDNGILTAALKLKRKTIESTYKRTIEELYSERKQRSSNGRRKSHDQNNNALANRQTTDVNGSNSNGNGTLTNGSSANGSSGNHSTQINIPPV